MPYETLGLSFVNQQQHMQGQTIGGPYGLQVPQLSTASGPGAVVRGPQASAGPHSNVYVRGCPLTLTEDDLLKLFSPYGAVQSVRIFRSSQNPLKPPFAFVKYGSVVEAQTAISHLNGAQLPSGAPGGGTTVLEVKMADADLGQGGNPERTPPPGDNVYVKNLPPTFTEDNLRQLFSELGLTVVMCRMLHHGDLAQGTGHQGGAALVRLASVEEAYRAVNSLHGSRPFGGSNNLVVRYADTAEIKARKHARQAGSQQPQALRYSPYGLTLPGAQPLGGAMKFVSMGPTLVPGMGADYLHGGGMQPQQQTLYTQGTDPSGAIYAAAGAGADHLFDPSSFLSSAAGGMSAATQNLMLAGAGGIGGGSALSKDGVASLYVKNLPLDADRLFLYEKFGPFGPILSVKILVDDQGKSKGVGFVNYAECISAAKAVAALHNLPVGDKHLHVAFQTPRPR